ncbi:helix-turn-helix domain-containing protein [Agromyces aerolatus]|uniref:helix-turn-helix domain-containing protein n=1 Tax=Agromyces sp. LY-1074 TaxID=3074080 RepID=UPI002863F078|nr:MULTISPECIES: AraC family transcriptional regulator [unclassified Agromyces]MDR5698207.1 AraC family transcriptional regulator [Agromyces sp. LY-1074]MDR5704501.1 AraC family transcriptional regulator [Agromyces sp. LY-1358]
MDDFWRSRAGVPRSRGVLAAQAGDPALSAAGPGAVPSPDAPIRMVRLPPSHALAELVRHFWIPRWRLPADRPVTQRVLEYPSTNLVIEGAGVAVHGPSIGLGSRTLAGEGRAFGVLLQPGVARMLLGIDSRALVGHAVPLEASGPLGASVEREASGPLEASDLRTMRETVSEFVAEGDDARAVAAFEAWFAGLGLRPSADARLVRELVARAEEDRALVRVEQLAEVAGVSVRQLERIVREQLGLTPRWLIRRYRLQEAGVRLTARDRPSLAELATELGYADQAHFTREFSAVIGVPPGRYVREAAEAATSSGGEVPA